MGGLDSIVTIGPVSFESGPAQVPHLIHLEPLSSANKAKIRSPTSVAEEGMPAAPWPVAGYLWPGIGE